MVIRIRRISGRIIGMDSEALAGQKVFVKMDVAKYGIRFTSKILYCK